VLGTLIVALTARGSSMLDVTNKKLTNYLYDERPLAEEVIIVEIDEHSMKAPEDGGLGGISNWSNQYYAQVAENVRADGANSMFLDILFNDSTKTVSFYDIASSLSEAASWEDFGTEMASYLEGESPGDALLLEALGPDVYLLKYPKTTEVLDGNVLTTTGSTGSIEYFTEPSSEAFGYISVIGNEQAVYGAPIGYLVDGSFEEGLALKMVRDYLYGEESSGLFTADQSAYVFDDLREVPAEDGQMLINYAANSYSFPMISFSEVFRGEFAPGTFEGKIVLIGATAAAFQDRHFTPIDQNIPMPGIEIQANAIQTVLDGEFLRNQGAGGFAMLVLVMIAAAAGAALYAPILLGAGVLAAEALVFPFYAQWSFGRGVIPDLIWPVAAALVAYFAAMAYRNFTEFREKRKLRTAFAHYVSPELVAQISENPGEVKLGGERRNITTMFLDIENFTHLSESLEPQQVVTVINTYFDALARVIMEHGGTVDKFEGDAIMALFGAPLAMDDHATAACKAALALREKMVELNAAGAAGSKDAGLNIRIGIASGEAIVGNMGSQDRFDYTAMGDTVNVASRLESGNKFYGTRTLVSGGTIGSNAGKAQETFVFRRVDRVRLKGKDEAIDIYEIMGAKAGLSKKGAGVLEVWHQALEYYRNQKWDEAEARVQEVLKAMPEDGPAKTYLKRIDWLRKNPLKGWDGTWGFERK